MAPTRAVLLKSAQALTSDFASKKDIDTLLSHFSTTHACTAAEHGEPFLAPFIGKAFSGHAQIRKYFELLQKHLTYENMSFGEFCVDTESCRVSCVGSAKFTWIGPKTNDVEEAQSWDEDFHYLLDFDGSDEPKVTEYQVWADTGAAYLAGRGELAAKRAEASKEGNK